MRHYSALVKHFMLNTAAALLLTLGARPAGAQITFDDLDWTTDRGNIVFATAGNLNAFPFRPGKNGATGNPLDPRFPKLDSKRAVRRWVWPTTTDLNGVTGGINPPTTSLSVIVDNPYFDNVTGLYLNKGDDNRFYDSIQYTNPYSADVSRNSLSQWTPGNGFVIPPPADRTVYGGFSFNFQSRESTGPPFDNTYPPAAAQGDYGYAYAHHNDFIVARGTNANPTSSPATAAELAQLPNASAPVYAAVQNVLVNAANSQPLAQWTLGATLNQNVASDSTQTPPEVPVPAGTYNISLYSPSGGTIIHHNPTTDIAHPNVKRALVRVSWGVNTVNNGVIQPGPGTAGGGGVNDPTTSRIYLMDLTAPGWLAVGQFGQAAVFPYDGNKNNQIVVTLYSVTPDDPNDPAKYGDPINNIPPTALVVADACRFTQENIDTNTNGPGLGPLPDPNASFIGSSGVIVSPVVGSNKFSPRGVAGATQWYVARQELTRDVTPRSYVDPTNGSSLPIPDPTRVATVPVFYCLSNEDQLGTIGDQNSARASKLRVLWRYVGYPDNGTSTVFASPVIANVRGRDGAYHTIVYFCGTVDGDQAGITGRIYALDAKGIALDPTTGVPTTASTIAYWTYPSVRPRSALDVTNQLPVEVEDPNYNNILNTAANSTAYPVNAAPYNTPGHWWAGDQQLFTNGAKFYYDGDIVADSKATGGYSTRTDTRIGTNGVGMGGITGAPIVIDDPVNPTGPMLLVVPSVDGRLYTFDAGGRGDYLQADGTTYVPGTSQRIWTWPHFSADAYHQYFTGTSPNNPVNRFKDETAKGSMPYAPAYDPTFPVAIGSVHNPILVSSFDGHVYAVQPFHDAQPAISSNGIANWTERRFWSYPHQTSGSVSDPSAEALFDCPGVPTIYKTGASTASVNFTSSGRIYSLAFPTVYPGSGFSTPGLRWVFPSTPNPPFQDPTDPTTSEYQQGFSAHGLVVVPQSVTTGVSPALPGDMVYALLSTGGVVAVNYTDGSYYSSGQSLLGAFSESAPIITEIAPDPAFYSPVRNLTSVAQSVPAIIFGDADGGMYGFKLVAESNNDGLGTVILPIIYARKDTSGELAAPPVLVASTTTATTGGYYAVGDTNGQLRAYSFGFGQYGDIESVPGSEGTGNGFVAGDVSIDMRVLDAYRKEDYDQMAQNRPVGYGSGKTSARRVSGATYPTTATRIPNNLTDNGNTYFALDEGGTLYLVASGVYHAQPVRDNIPNGTVKGATEPPTIRVTFTVAQNGGPSVNYPVTVPVTPLQPTSNTDADGNGPWPHIRQWPDDRAISVADHDQLTIYGNDYSDPANPPDPVANPPSGAKQLTGRAQNVYPWIARMAIPLLPTATNGRSTFTPNTVGYMVSANAVITQPLTTKSNSGNATTNTATDSAYLTMGQRADLGKSNSPYPPDPNNQGAGNFQSRQRLLYITNPLALTVRGFNGANTDQTSLTQYNIIGWYGAVDNPNLGNPGKGLELTGNGAFVGIGGATPGQPGQGVLKPVFAPFDLTQDNSSATYQGIDNAGQRRNAFYIMDRSNLARFYGPIAVRARMTPLKWTGTATSVMNPLPFDVLPDNPYAQGLDYPNLDPGNAKIIINQADALRGTATLSSPQDDPAHPGDPAYRIPRPTAVTMSMQVPKYFPANVNRGQIRTNFRGTNIDYGSSFTDLAGFVRGVRTKNANYEDTNPVVGPLNTVSGQADQLTKGLVGSSPAAGYTGNIDVELVPPQGSTGGTTAFLRRTTFNQAAGITANRRSGSSGNQAYRTLDTGICVAPTFRMKVLESVLDMGNVPHGTGYSDLVANTSGYPGAAQYRLPFAPSATGSYATSLSPWDINEQFAALAPGVGFPSQGQFFRPFTLVSDSNVNLINLRVAKLLGVPNTTDNSAAPNMSGLINNGSLSQNPIPGVARAARLYSDQVNNLLSPPMIAAPFGMNIGGGSFPNFLGNIGVVSSFDHDSYSQSILGENNLYPIANPAVDARAVAQAAELYTLYGPALFGPQWNINQQGRPSLHKPRVNDSSGSIATVPDKPHDFDFQANALNAPVGNQNYLQQQLGLGKFAPPAMAIAVPVGTPVGTYSAPIFPYEDALPIQWQEWLSASTGATKPADIHGNNDDILNTTLAGALSEPYANPAPTLKLAVREGRLTEGATAGTMPQIDLRNSQGGYDPIGANLQPSAIMVPQGSSGANIYNKIFLYWATNRQLDPSRNNGQYQSGGLPTPFAPYNIAYSSLNTPYAFLNGYFRGDADFGVYKNGNAITQGGITLPQLWSAKYPKNSPFALLPGFDGTGLPLDYLNLFPQPAGSPDKPNAASVRYGSPATTLATLYDVSTGLFGVDQESYLTVQGSVDKVDPTKRLDPANPNIGLLVQRTETRTFVASLSNSRGNSEPGAPDYAAGTTDNWLKSFANDPDLPKLSPRPLLIKLRKVPVSGGPKDIKFLYVFWYAGAQGRTSLYYNVNVQANGLTTSFNDLGFQVLGDQKLSTPGSLNWQSDPYPVFRRAFDPTSGQIVDAVDVMFTGQLKNRQTVEILMGRYRIVEQAAAATTNTPAYAVGQLVPIPFPTVHQESLTPVPGTNTYAARDAAWFLPSDKQATDAGAAATAAPAYNRFMRVYLQPKATGKVYLVNGEGYINGGTNAASGAPQRGRSDPASGLVYFNALAVDPANNNIALNGANRPLFGGGQMVVDARSGTVSFPNIPPGKKDAIFASYTPYIMRVNASRDEFNIERDSTDVPGNPALYGNFAGAFSYRPAALTTGQNYAATVVMDRAANFRGTLQSPQVLFTVNNQPATSFNNQGVMTTNFLPPITRMWTLYRKTDAAGSIKASVFMKSQRLMARLPLPVATVATNGTPTSPLAAQRIQSITVVGIDRPTQGYEVDWVRGRVYFQEEDEGNVVRINYNWYNPNTRQSGNSGNLYYRVAWGDEISATGATNGDQTTPEVAMPTSSVVNEGQVAAFKDPFIDKLWVFWSSTRAGTSIGPANNPLPLGQTDLYYETLAPQFYSPASNQY